MSEFREITRKLIRNYCKEKGEPGFRLQPFLEFAEPYVSEEFPEREFLKSRLRESLEHLHRQDEITYIGDQRYRIRDLNWTSGEQVPTAEAVAELPSASCEMHTEEVQGSVTYVELTIVVKDSDGSPLQDAAVTLNHSDFTSKAQTGLEGRCSFQVKLVEEVEVITSKPGFQIDKSTVTLPSQKESISIQLVPYSEKELTLENSSSTGTESRESSRSEQDYEDEIDTVLRDLRL